MARAIRTVKRISVEECFSTFGQMLDLALQLGLSIVVLIREEGPIQSLRGIM